MSLIRLLKIISIIDDTHGASVGLVAGYMLYPVSVDAIKKHS